MSHKPVSGQLRDLPEPNPLRLSERHSKCGSESPISGGSFAFVISEPVTRELRWLTDLNEDFDGYKMSYYRVWPRLERKSFWQVFAAESNWWYSGLSRNFASRGSRCSVT